jgi:hypothetical protein
MLHQRSTDAVVDSNSPNQSNDDGKALAGLLHTVLKEVGVGLGALVAFVVYWVAAALLLNQLAD